MIYWNYAINPINSCYLVAPVSHTHKHTQDILTTGGAQHFMCCRGVNQDLELLWLSNYKEVKYY